jgi:uncharacterized protein YdiU (UPF0061 family)
MARISSKTFCNDTNHRYFTVYEVQDDGLRNFLEQLIESYIGAAEERDQNHALTINRIKDAAPLITKTPWLRRTKWEERFLGKDMKELNMLADAPGSQVYDEHWIWEGVKETLNKCSMGFYDVLERGWELIPFWLAS